MQIAILLFDRFTCLDAIGPYQVLSGVPGAEVSFVAERPDSETKQRRAAGTPDSVQVLTVLDGGARAVYDLSGVAPFGIVNFWSAPPATSAFIISASTNFAARR